MANLSIHEAESIDSLEKIKQEAAAIAAELVEKSGLKKGQIVVIGCSSSEVTGHNMGSWSTPDIGQAIFDGLYSVFKPMGIYMAAQCCEHLNRAIIIERAASSPFEQVNVLPQPKAGGSFATAAYKTFEDAVAIEEVKADAGIDIGGTLIGMHLKKVAVPVKLEHNHLGQAIVLAARTRLKYIGGERAHYQPE